MILVYRFKKESVYTIMKAVPAVQGFKDGIFCIAGTYALSLRAFSAG